MRIRGMAVAILATFLTVGTLAAQDLAVGLRVGFDGPLGDYSATTEYTPAGVANGAGAQTGFFAGADVWLPVIADGLSWYSSVEYSKVPTGIDGFTQGDFVHIPLMTGLRYELTSLVTGSYLTAQAGLIMGWGPDVFLPYSESYADNLASVNFGYNVGLGFQLSETAYVTAKYFPPQAATYEYDGASQELEVDYSSLQFGLGFRVF